MPDDLLQRREQFDLFAVVLTTNKVATLGCSHRLEYVCNVSRVLVSRFYRADAFRNQVIPAVVVELAGEFEPVLRISQEFQCSLPPPFHDKGLDKSRFVRVHTGTVHPERHSV